MRTPRRAIALLPIVFALCGCLPGPVSPDSASTKAYRWRATLAGAASEPIYRFDLTPEFQRWMDDNGVRSVAVFDALGRSQSCGRLGSTHAPLSSTTTTFEGRIAPYDPAACKAHDELPICFAGEPCTLPDYCPRIEINLNWTSLGEVTTLDQLVDIANKPRPPFPCEVSSDVGCTPEHVPANDAISQERGEARSALVRAGLDRMVKPDPPRLQRRNWFSPGETLNKDGTFVIPASPVLPDREAVARNAELRRYDNSGGYVVEFDEPASELTFYWRRPDATRIEGKTTVIAYNAEGRRFGNTSPLYPTNDSPPGMLQQAVRGSTPMRTFRVVTEANAPDMQLVEVKSTTYADKPFIDARKRQFWFAAHGTAPYSIYAERGRGTCAGGDSVEISPTDARLREPDRPLPLAVGERIENQRSLLASLAVDHYDVFVWLCWLGLLLLIWAPGACLIAVRWINLDRRVAARQRRP